MVYWGHHNGNEALENFDAALKYDPKDPVTYLNKARVYYELKNNDELAIEALKKAIDIRLDYSEAYYRLALIYLHQHDESQAIRQLLDAIKYDPKSLDAHLQLAAIYRDERKFSDGIKYLNKAMGFAATDFVLYKEFGKFYEAESKNEDAIRSYEEALKLLKSDDVFGKELYLCRIVRLKGQYDEAISCFQRIKLPSAEDPGQIMYDVGLTYVASKNKEAARAQYEQLKQMKSSLAEDLLRQINDMK
jgi:tetratricopeptide (TPR) repeat protein